MIKFDFFPFFLGMTVITFFPIQSMMRVMRLVTAKTKVGSFIFKDIALMAAFAQQAFVGVLDFIVRIFIVVEFNQRPALIVMTFVAFDAVITLVHIT